jgi:NAD(P)-dependent dehydrogenase (short-subunit alcohol dehydrogenase family)
VTRCLEGRVAIVTGGGRGLGRAHALALAAEGARVAVVDPGVALDGSAEDAGVAAAVAAEIGAAGGDAIALAVEVGGEDAARSVIGAALAAFGRLDVLVNNAGISVACPFDELELEIWERVLRTHLTATFTLSREAFRVMRPAGRGGCIVNTTSGAGIVNAYRGSAAYAAAKGGIAGLTRVIAAEGAPHGITCNAIAPLARTRMSGGFLASGGAPGMRSDGGEPELVSPLVVFLASDAGRGVSGRIFRAADGRLGLFHSTFPAGVGSRGARWTRDEIEARLDEILGS